MPQNDPLGYIFPGMSDEEKRRLMGMSMIPAIAEKAMFPAVAEKPLFPAVAEKFLPPAIAQKPPLAPAIAQKPVEALREQMAQMGGVYGNAPPQPMQPPRTASGRPFKNFGPEVQAYLQSHPFTGQQSNSPLLEAIQRANSRPMPKMGYASGFGLGETSPGAADKIAKAIAGIQPTSTPGGLTASQKRQLAVPQQPKSILQQAIDGDMPFGTPEDKLQRGLAGVDKSRVSIGVNPETGRTTLTGKLTKFHVTDQQRADAKRAAAQRVKLKAKRLGLPADLGKGSLAEIQLAESELEKIQRNRNLGLPDDFGSENIAAKDVTPMQAGIEAVKAAKASKRAATKNPFAELTPKEGETAFMSGHDGRKSEIEFERQQRLEQNRLDAETARREKDRELQKTLSQNQIMSQEKLTDKQIASAEKLSEAERKADKKSSRQNRKHQESLTDKEIKSREKLAESEQQSKDKGFQAERDQKAWGDAITAWSTANGGLPQTPQDWQEVRGIASTVTTPIGGNLAQAIAQDLPQGNPNNFQFGNVPANSSAPSNPTPVMASRAEKWIATNLPAGIQEELANTQFLQRKLDLLRKNGYAEGSAAWNNVVAAHNGKLPPAKQESPVLPPKGQGLKLPGMVEIKPPQRKKLPGLAGALGLNAPSWPF